jgi:FkbM family methyltransferase
MSHLKLSKSESSRWFNDDGDNTHNINYPLTEESIVMDLGGYMGRWANQIIKKYNPYMFIIEPIHYHYNYMVNKFANNNKVKLMNVGISNEDKEDIIFINGDQSSFYSAGTSENVKLLTMQSIFNKWNLEKVDLLQINIEGHEYLLLEYLVNEDILDKFKYIQIQFHQAIENHIMRREAIHTKLKDRGFKNRFNYPFIWESWENCENRK